MTRIIAIGGMIASGKSTLLENISKNFDIQIIEEFRNDDEVFNKMLEWLYTGKPIEFQLQTYFIEKHYNEYKRHSKEDVVIDRHLIEHWLFAQHNLKDKFKLHTYNSLFQMYMSELPKPDLYLILDINWDTFVKRIHERGRKVEIDNFEKNKEYFKSLISDYVEKVEAQCKIYNIDYKIIDANVSEDEVFKIVKELI